MINIIDTKKTLDLIKIRSYTDNFINAIEHNRQDGEIHQELTDQVLVDIIDPLMLPPTTRILDIDCSTGYFMDSMRHRGFSSITGITLGNMDYAAATEKGHTVKYSDLCFLSSQHGFDDSSYDFVFARHVLNKSLFPMFNLVEYNRILAQGGKLYVEVPAPECPRGHENLPNQFSILGKTQWAALLTKAGFDIDAFKLIDFEITENNGDGDRKLNETYYGFLATKRFSLDIK